MTTDDIHKLLDGASYDISNANNLSTIDLVRATYLGKKGVLTEILKKIATLPPEQRPEFGQKINSAKEKIQLLLSQQTEKIKFALVAADLALETVDVTLPAWGQKLGNLHPITKIRNRSEDFFVRMGFTIADGPEIEDEFHNFTALNFPEHHPARYMQDTFYFPDGLLLRTHTSPVQIRVMKNGIPPFRIIAPGRVYRCDSDATHSPMFHQIECLVVADGINFGNLKWVLREFLNDFFGREMQFRFRASYFPFTEPSAEIDLWWTNNAGQSRWLEVGGCGMVHPNVLKAVGLDSEVYSGFAFGLGLDRLTMLWYGIDDLRMFFENDIRFLEQF